MFWLKQLPIVVSNSTIDFWKNSYCKCMKMKFRDITPQYILALYTIFYKILLVFWNFYPKEVCILLKKNVTHANFSSLMRISSNVHLETLSVFENQRKPSFIYRHWKVRTSYANRKWFLSLIHGFFAVFRRAQSYLKSREYYFSGCERTSWIPFCNLDKTDWDVGHSFYL